MNKNDFFSNSTKNQSEYIQPQRYYDKRCLSIREQNALNIAILTIVPYFVVHYNFLQERVSKRRTNTMCTNCCTKFNGVKKLNWIDKDTQMEVFLESTSHISSKMYV